MFAFIHVLSGNSPASSKVPTPTPTPALAPALTPTLTPTPAPAPTPGSALTGASSFEHPTNDKARILTAIPGDIPAYDSNPARRGAMGAPHAGAHAGRAHCRQAGRSEASA